MRSKTLSSICAVYYDSTMDVDNINVRLGARIRAERENRGWSLSELADRAKVSRAMVHKVERGDSSPTASFLGKLSGAFGLSMSVLLARTEAAGEICCAGQSNRFGPIPRRAMFGGKCRQSPICHWILSRLPSPLKQGSRHACVSLCIHPAVDLGSGRRSYL